MTNLHLLTQNGISLQEQLFVMDQMLEINLVELRDDFVEKLPSHFVAIVDDVAVVRRDHHHGEKPHVVAQPFVFLLVSLQRLCPVLIDTAHLRAVPRFLVGKIAVQREKIRSQLHRTHILSRKAALPERQIMNGIQQVGLAAAIRTHDAVHVAVEREGGFSVGFEISEMDGFEVHFLKML